MFTCSGVKSCLEQVPVLSPLKVFPPLLGRAGTEAGSRSGKDRVRAVSRGAGGRSEMETRVPEQLFFRL